MQVSVIRSLGKANKIHYFHKSWWVCVVLCVLILRYEEVVLVRNRSYLALSSIHLTRKQYLAKDDGDKGYNFCLLITLLLELLRNNVIQLDWSCWDWWGFSSCSLWCSLCLSRIPDARHPKGLWYKIRPMFQIVANYVPALNKFKNMLPKGRLGVSDFSIIPVADKIIYVSETEKEWKEPNSLPSQTSKYDVIQAD